MDIFSLANGRVNRITRWFRINEGTTDHANIPSVTLSGDWVIEFDCLASDALSANSIIGTTGTTNNSIFVSANNLSVRDSSGATVTTSGAVFASNQINNCRIVKLSGVIDIYINGVLSGTGASTSSITLSQLYVRNTTNFPLSGIIANLSIVDAGTLVRLYPINESSGATIIDEVSGQNGTIAVGSNDDRGLFQEVSRGGNWQGSGLTVPPWASVNQILVVA